jgi:hypothetical protein
MACPRSMIGEGVSDLKEASDSVKDSRSPRPRPEGVGENGAAFGVES